jgi:hypothetical protein
MPLQPQHAAIKFAGGIETKQDPKSVPAAKLLSLENGVFTKAISVKKRNGYLAHSKIIESQEGSLADEITDARRLGCRDKELLEFTKARCYSHQNGADQWSDVGPVYSVNGKDRPIVHTGTEMTTPDHATNNNVSVVAWEDSRGGVYYTVLDATSGRVHVEAREVYSGLGADPRCVASGPNLHVYFTVPTESAVRVLVINPENPSVVTASALLLDDLDTTNPRYDACPTSRTGTPAAIVWYEKATTNFRLGYVDSSGVLGSPATGHPSVYRQSGMQALRTDTPLAVAYKYVDGGDADVLAAAAVNTRATSTCALYHFNGGTSAASIGTTAQELWVDSSIDTTIVRCTVALTTTKVWGVFEDITVAGGASNRFARIRSQLITETFTTAATIDDYKQRSVTLVSRAFVVDDEVFAYFSHDTTYFNTYFALRISSAVTDSDGNARLICVARETVGGSVPIATGERQHLSSAHLDGTIVKTCLEYRTRLESEDNDKFGESRPAPAHARLRQRSAAHQSGADRPQPVPRGRLSACNTTGFGGPNKGSTSVRR